MRGQDTLFNNLLPTSVTIDNTRKGRKSVHQDRRDDALAYRYFYCSHILRKRYDDCLVQLESEFHITPSVIVQRLSERQDMLKYLVKNNVKKEALKKKLPHFVW